MVLDDKDNGNLVEYTAYQVAMQAKVVDIKHFFKSCSSLLSYIKTL